MDRQRSAPGNPVLCMGAGFSELLPSCLRPPSAKNLGFVWRKSFERSAHGAAAVFVSGPCASERARRFRANGVSRSIRTTLDLDVDVRRDALDVFAIDISNIEPLASYTRWCGQSSTDDLREAAAQTGIGQGLGASTYTGIIL
jgi:hypothetical protein